MFATFVIILCSCSGFPLVPFPVVLLLRIWLGLAAVEIPAFPLSCPLLANRE